MNYVYLLRCSDGSLYCGWTTDLDARLKAHNSGKGAKYTRSRLPVELAYYETYEDRHEALSREWHVKRLPREEKLALIRDGKKEQTQLFCCAVGGGVLDAPSRVFELKNGPSKAPAPTDGRATEQTRMDLERFHRGRNAPCRDDGIAVKETGKPKVEKGVKHMTTYCGENCCKDCDRLSACGGCEQCQGHPFGGSCVAERNKDFPALKRRLIKEINALGIEGLAVADLNLLTGSYVNLSYPLANGSAVRFLNDRDIYLGNQIERADSERCYGIVANEAFILVCEYGCNGSDPEIVLYKRR